MTDLTKLANALENIAHMEYPSGHHDGNNLREAARILRAAAGADVAALMAMIDDHGGHRWSTGYNEGANHVASATKNDKDAQKARAALESALRLALAAREGFVMVPVEPTTEMVDAGSIEWENHNSGSPYDAEIPAIYRAMIAAAPKGTP